MSRRYTRAYIIERALRKVGSFSINDEGADLDEVKEAEAWLDLIVGHVAADQRTWWLVPATARIDLVAGQTEYDLATLLGDDAVQNPISLHLVEPTTAWREQLELLTREEWENAARERRGPPEAAYIDRAQNPTLKLVGTPQAQPPARQLEFVYQTWPADITAIRPTATIPGIRSSWAMFLVVALAAELGNGPVRKQPADEVADMKRQAQKLLNDLHAYDNHEQQSGPAQVAFNDF